MAGKSLNWTGQAVTEKMKRAQIAGVNQTMAACVQHAKTHHAWNNETGVLEGSIDIVDYAAPKDAGVAGTWGSQDVEYALIHELGGIINHPGGTPYYIGPGGIAHFVSLDSSIARYLPRTKPHVIDMPARPYLRPAADVQYPTLPGRIRKAYEAKGTANG